MFGGAHRFDRIAAWGLAAFAVAALWPLRDRGLMLNDDGWYLHPVMRMMQGELLYRDVWTFYAPGIHHALQWIFEATGGPSILAARTFWLALIATTTGLTWCFARRFVPVWLAWLPAVTYALVPGPWHKSYFATLTITCFVLLARAFERPGAARFAAFGAAAGLALVTRQDVGFLALGIGLVAAPLPALVPRGFDRAPERSVRDAVVWLAALLGAFTVPVAATAGWYGAQGVLPELLDASFTRAFAQADVHPGASAVLGSLLSPTHFAMASEGRFVGVLMLLPLVLYLALGVVLARRVLRDGVTREHALLGALLAFAAATLGQAWRPLLLLRFLQSALPFYLLATIATGQAIAWLRARGAPNAAYAVAVAAFGGAALLVGQVVCGLPGVVQPAYTGSYRALRLTHPVDVLGDRFYEGFALADEIRMVRAFFAERGAGEPILAIPALPLYHAILERPNPTRFLSDHPTGDFVMTTAQKREDAERLLASPTRFALVDQGFWARTAKPDPLLATLLAEFHPVRGYGSVLVLERGNDPAWSDFAARLRTALTRGADPADVEAWRRFAADHPDEPLAWRMLGTVLQAGGDANGAIAAYERAVALDPADVGPLEAIAQIHARRGRAGEARAAMARAAAVRESPTLQRLGAALATPGAPAATP